jgi:uracil-DNA glycosylase family 4
MSTYRKKEKVLPDPKLPDFTLPPPKLSDFAGFDSYTRYKTDDNPNYDNITFLNGIGNNKDPDILFITSCPYIEDIDESTSEPRLLKSPVGVLFERLCLINGIDLQNQYFTTICKYAVPKKQKLKPTAKDIAYCSALLEEEISNLKPKIVVCIGKEATVYALGLNIRLSKLEECWCRSEKFDAPLFIISSISDAYFKPEYYDKLSAELNIVNDMRLAIINGLSILKVEQKYKKIETFKDLDDWLNKMSDLKRQVFAVDCEWRGQNFIDGNLRSIQFCDSPGNAVFIHLFNEDNQWVFDVPYEVVKFRLQQFFNQPFIRYYGHNFCADAVWMMNHLGIEAYGRCILDTQYAFQTFNEYEDLALKKLAAKYTDMGRYDIDLILWSASKVKKSKKTNDNKVINNLNKLLVNLEEDDSSKKKIEGNDDEGYGSVPTDILYPYGCRDVDATFRLAQLAFQNLAKDNTLSYYINIKNPFVTDGFTSMMEAGIPFDRTYANKARISYLACSLILQNKFKDLLVEDALQMYNDNCNLLDITDNELINCISDKALNKTESFEDLVKFVKSKLKTKEKIFGILPYVQHLYNIDIFNPNSPDQKRHYLFNLKKYEPIKTTKTDSGNPLDWSRVKVLPEKEQKEYTAAVDKDTLNVYATHGDPICAHLLEMSAIGTILKTFLKGDEGGIQKFICKDSKVHCNLALTESSRPRSFKPNILNLPRYVTDRIKSAYRKTYEFFNIKQENGEIDYSNYNKESFETIVQKLREDFNIEETITIEDLLPVGLRSCFRAPDNYYFVDADLATAEVFALGFLANDRNLINALTLPDPQFAIKKMPDGSKKPFRIAYIDDVVTLSEDAKDPSLLHDPNDPEFLRDENGNLLHPKRDLHWEATENMHFLNTPREKLDKNSTRDAAGKASNFQIPYQASGKLLERLIENATGKKPEEGTGDKLIEAYKLQKPQAWEWLETRKQEIFDPGYYTGPSGYKRHWKLPSDDVWMPSKLKEKIISGIQRQASNIGLQSLVADTLQRALLINKFFRENNFKTRAVVPLYDALYLISPIDEIDLAKDALAHYLSKANFWNLPGGRLSFNIDVEITKAWGTKMTKQEEEEFDSLYSITKQKEYDKSKFEVLPS